MGKKGHGQVTLRNIADALGVSVNTVSCALKGRNSISPETVQRVKDKARELGYIPNSIASSMRTGYTNTIAIILGDIANAYFAIMVKELELCIRREGCATIILVTDENPELENKAIQTALSKNVDGILLFPTCQTQEGVALLRKMNAPFVLIGRRFPDHRMNYIVSDDIQGGYLATRYLIDRGHTNILLFTGPDCISSANERKLGYIRAMEEAGLAYTDTIIPCGITASDDMDRLICDTFRTHHDATAVFTYNDIIAFRMIRLLRSQQKPLPEVVGYDNVQSRIDFDYSIPSVNIHKSVMAEKATARLFQLIRNEETTEQYMNEVVPVELFSGESWQ